MKRIVSFSLIIISLFSMFAVFPANADAALNGDKLFTAKQFLYKVKSDGTADIMTYLGSSKNITIPAKLDGKKVTALSNLESWRSDDLNINKLIIAANTKVIRKGALEYCSIKQIKIGSKVEKIGAGGVSADNLVKLSVDKKNKHFYSEKNVLFDKNGTRLIAYAQCKSGSEYKIPDKVRIISGSAFYRNKKLKRVTFPKKLKTIGDFAFAGSRLTSVGIPEGVVKVGNSAFTNCEKLKKVRINANKKLIFGDSVFSADESLKSVKMPKLYKGGNDIFAECHDLTKVSIPKGITVIPEGAFQDCDIEKITVPKSVKKIEKDAFLGCRLKQATVKSDQTKIGKRALGYVVTDYTHYWSAPDSDFTIIAPVSSYAEEYAEKYGFKYKRI